MNLVPISKAFWVGGAFPSAPMCLFSRSYLEHPPCILLGSSLCSLNVFTSSPLSSERLCSERQSLQDFYLFSVLAEGITRRGYCLAIKTHKNLAGEMIQRLKH